jgi:cell division transport system permease protein
MSLWLALREAFRGFWRTGMVGLISVATIGASLLMVGVFGHVVAGGYALVGKLRERVEVDIYIKEGVQQRQILALQHTIEGLSGVAEVLFIDKEAASKEFQDMFGSGILDALSQNPLPVSLRVRLHPESDMSKQIQAVTKLVGDLDIVESVAVGESWVDALDRFVKIITGVGLLLGGVLCLACGFAVSNTAKLMVLVQRDAIEIMRLVGATLTTVRLTFLLGGALQGFMGGMIASFGLSYALDWWMSQMPDFGMTAPLNLGFWMVFLGTLLGAVGSWASLNRVLNALSIK